MQLLLERLTEASKAHPGVLLHAFHDDVVVAGPLGALARFLADATAWGASIDAELAPAKCVCWAPAGAPAQEGWVGAWGAEGLVQFSVPLGAHEFVSRAVDRLARGMRELTDAMLALPPTDLQGRLLLLRLCAGPRTNYWLRGLSLVACARHAGAVDHDAGRALASLLCDTRDSSATREAVLERAALPVSMERLGVGAQARVLPAAALASWVSVLRYGRHAFPALAAVAGALERAPRG